MFVEELSKLKKNKKAVAWIVMAATMVLMIQIFWTFNDIWADFDLGIQIMLILITVLVLVLFGWEKRPKVFRKWS